MNDDETIEGFLRDVSEERKSTGRVLKCYHVIKKATFDVRVEACEYDVDDRGVLHFFGKDDLCLCSFKDWDYVQMTMP